MEIPYKEKNTEFEIQSYLYQSLLDLGVNVRGNVSNGRKRDRGNAPKMHFDLVIYDKENKAQKIIEVKDSINHRLNTAQHEKYKTTGLEVIYARGMKEARKLVQKFKDYLESEER